MEGHGIPYFRDLWQKNMSCLENWCKAWEHVCSDDSVPDDVHGEIRTAVGLARLLMNQKLKQFKGLIDDSEFHTGEKEITCSDLEGFWDMVYFEVEKIEKMFDRLNKCKSNEWKFIEENSENLVKRKVPLKKDTKVITNKRKELLDAQRLAARERIAEARRKMIAERKEGKDQTLFKVLKPDKEEQSQSSNSVDNEIVTNAVAVTDKTKNKAIIQNGKQPFGNKKIMVTPAKTNVAVKESQNLNDMSKQVVLQRKKHSASVHNKENVFLDNDSTDVKCVSAKQTGTEESAKKTRTKKDFVKLQCVTRSAAKKAMLLHQNALHQ